MIDHQYLTASTPFRPEDLSGDVPGSCSSAAQQTGYVSTPYTTVSSVLSLPLETTPRTQMRAAHIIMISVCPYTRSSLPITSGELPRAKHSAHHAHARLPPSTCPHTATRLFRRPSPELAPLPCTRGRSLCPDTRPQPAPISSSPPRPLLRARPTRCTGTRAST